MCHVPTGAVCAVAGMSKSVTPGQPVVAPGGREVVYTGWSNLPVRRGMIYCFQRPCALYAASIEDARAEFEAYSACAARTGPFDVYKKDLSAAAPKGESPAAPVAAPPHRLLTPSLRLARSPRFAPDGSFLVFLGSTAGYDTHGGCSELFRLPWALPDAAQSSETDDTQQGAGGAGGEGGLTVLVPRVEVPSEGAWCGFPGLFTGSLPAQCFLDECTLVLESSWGFVSAALLVDVRSGALGWLHAASGAVIDLPRDSSSSSLGSDNAVRRLMTRAPPASCSVLDVSYGSSSSPSSSSSSSVLLLLSSPEDPGRLVLLDFPRADAAAASSAVAPRSFSERNSVTFSSDTLPPMAVTAKCLPVVPSSPTASPSTAPAPTAAGQLAVSSELLRFTPPGTAEGTGLSSAEFFEGLLILPTAGRKGHGGLTSPAAAATPPPPLLVVPHGGPHSVFSSAFLAPYYFICVSAQVAVLFVNYRGSTVSE